MEIRIATSSDAAVLAALNVDVQRIHAEAYPHIFIYPHDSSFALPFMQERLVDPDSYFYLASLDGEDVGYVYARLVNRPGNPFALPWRVVVIDQISVKPSHQRQGIGEALVQQVRALARALGVTTIALDTWAFNEGAHAFFARQGFHLYNLRMWTDEPPGGSQIPGESASKGK